MGYVISSTYFQNYDYEVMITKTSGIPYTGTDCYDDGLFSDDGSSSSSEPSSSTPTVDFPVSGTYFNTTGYTLPSLPWDYKADFQGTLYIVDDLNENDDGGLLDGLIGFFSNIWDWLTSFWDSFKNALLSLFVPSNGYFTNWFSEIKAAFEAKTGGITGVFEHIADSLDTLKSGSVSESSVILKTNDNYLFSGYKGISVDLLAHAKLLLQWLRTIFNGILVIFTVITCYRNLIKTIKS